MIVYAHVDPTTAFVWTGPGSETPFVTPHSISEFLEEIHDSTRLRVLGWAPNDPLISAAYRAGKTVEVAGPDILESPEELPHPILVIYRMRQCLRNPSIGGFHTVTALDYETYRLCESLPRIMDPLQHPVIRTMQFITGLDIVATARVIAEIRDPRWFIDPQCPDRLARLRSYLGLTPKLQKKAEDIANLHPRINRCRMVMSAWKLGGEPSVADLGLPGNFLWRRWLDNGRGSRGDLRASQCFISLLARVWLAALVKAASPNTEPLFSPELFFRKEEAAAYKEFVKNLA